VCNLKCNKKKTFALELYYFNKISEKEKKVSSGFWGTMCMGTNYILGHYMPGN
jgi:hypothetical protein